LPIEVLYRGNWYFYHFCSGDLELDRHWLEIYRLCRYELPTSRLSKVIVWQTDRHDRNYIYHAASRVVNNNISSLLSPLVRHIIRRRQAVGMMMMMIMTVTVRVYHTESNCRHRNVIPWQSVTSDVIRAVDPAAHLDVLTVRPSSNRLTAPWPSTVDGHSLTTAWPAASVQSDCDRSVSLTVPLPAESTEHTIAVCNNVNWLQWTAVMNQDVDSYTSTSWGHVQLFYKQCLSF